MMKKVLASALVMVSLAGCGTTGVTTAAQAPALGAQALAKKKADAPAFKIPANVDETAFNQGLQAGTAQAAGKTANVRQGMGVDPTSYAYGFAVGLIQGSLNAYNRIRGSYDATGWLNFAKMNRDAMKDALNALQNNATLAPKCGVAIGILSGAIQSFDSINGSFDASQWLNFANMNRNALQNALNALQSVSFQ